MWSLSTCKRNSVGDWLLVSHFATIGEAAETILRMEGQQGAGIFFETFIYKDDEGELGGFIFEYTGPTNLYSVKLAKAA